MCIIQYLGFLAVIYQMSPVYTSSLKGDILLRQVYMESRLEKTHLLRWRFLRSRCAEILVQW